MSRDFRVISERILQFRDMWLKELEGLWGHNNIELLPFKVRV